MILGIDVGQRSGWALAAEDACGRVKIIDHGIVRLPTSRGPGANLERLREWWEGIPQVEAVWVEGVGFARFRLAHASYWRIRTLWEITGAPYPQREVSVGSLKKWATGSGKADKAEMCQAARERYGVTLRAKAEGGSAADEDRADACHVAAYGVVHAG